MAAVVFVAGGGKEESALALVVVVELVVGVQVEVLEVRVDEVCGMVVVV